jgi:hypothetical protein
LAGHAVNRSTAVSSAVKDGGIEKEAETGILSLEARATYDIGASSLPDARHWLVRRDGAVA